MAIDSDSPAVRTSRGPGARPAKKRARQRTVGLRDFLPYLRPYRGVLVLVAVLSLAEAAGTLAQPLLTRHVLSRLGDSQPVLWPVVALIGILLAAAVLAGLRDYALQRTAEGMVLLTRRRLVGHILRLPIAEYDRRQTGDLLSRVGADTTLLRAVVTSGLFESATSLVLVIGSATMMVLLDPVLFLATAAGIAGGVCGVLLLAGRVRGASREAQDRIGTMTAAVERALSAARTIRANNAEERESIAIDGNARQAHDAGLRIARLQALISPATSTTIQAALLVVLGVGGARVASGHLELGDLVAYVLFLFMLWFPLGRALSAYTRLQTGLGALHRIHEVMDLPLEQAGDKAPAAVARPRGPAPAIAFDRVSFAYPTGERVLDDVSFEVPRGTRTALVGPSGAGKTTLLALVERFYDVTGGTVRIDGSDVRELPRHQLRQRLGYVEQEAPVLAGTIRDNLALSAPSATEQDMLRVLDLVNLTGLVTRAPEGLDTVVGEAGVLLSGGERQRLAIARTFLAARPVMLLDEATSNLDARNEAALRDAIDAVSADRTLLIVAHRLSTVIGSDQIVVMDRGRVVARGHHDELSRTSPLYRELAAHQFLAK